MPGIQTFQRRGNGKINGFDIFVPVVQFPGIPVGITLDDPFMADLRAGNDPDNDQLCVLLAELGAEPLHRLFAVDFSGKWGVDQDDIIIFQRFRPDIHDGFILIIADIFFEEFGASVDLLPGRDENTVG